MCPIAVIFVFNLQAYVYALSQCSPSNDGKVGKMKRFACIAFILTILFCATACTAESGQAQHPNNYISTICSKDAVDEFMSICGAAQYGGLLSGFHPDKTHCYNVTPASVSAETDIKIFKFSDSCASFALIDGEVFEICTSFGGFGFVNAVPWDYDEDRTADLLIASSWGSGMHRSEISVFNAKTKQSIVLFDTSTTEHPSVDLFVGAALPSFLPGRAADLPSCYPVYSVQIKANEDNFAALSYVATDVVGFVFTENGTPVFKPCETWK